MSTHLHPHVTSVWGDIPIGLGTSVVAFKPSVEVCQIGYECINHLHHIHHSRITILTSWLLNKPISFVNTRWSATFLFFSSFTFSAIVATTISSLVFTNFTSLEILIAELLSPIYPNLVLGKKWVLRSTWFLYYKIFHCTY